MTHIEISLLRNYVAEHANVKRGEIARECNLPPIKVSAYLRELVKAGVIVAEGKTRGTKYRAA